MLLFVDFLDELASGVPMVGAPDVRAAFGLGYGDAAVVLLVLPELLAFVLEPPLFLLSDRIGKRRLVLAGLFGLGICFIAAGLAEHVVLFAVALVLIYPASGLGVSLSQAVLMDTYPRQRDRVMTRWTLMGSIGDAMTPVFLAVVATFGGSWRVAFVLAGVFFILHGLIVARARWRERSVTEESEAPFLDLLRQASRNGRLWLWSFGVALCGLLDEVYVAFAAMYLRDRLGAGRLELDFVMTAGGAGAIIGLLATERLLRRARPLRVLLGTSLLTTGSFVVWLFAPNLVLSGVTMFFVGAFAAPLYPIAQAQAYAVSSSGSGTAAAVNSAFAPVRLAFPFLVGYAADELGLTTALLLLLIQPVGLMVVAALDRRES